jgi:hypothetical protein
MANGQLGDVLGDPEAGHQLAHVATEIVQLNADAAVTLSHLCRRGPARPAAMVEDRLSGVDGVRGLRPPDSDTNGATPMATHERR